MAHDQTQLQDRARGTTILDESRATKKLKLSDYLKRCPVKWARDTNPRNMNLGAFGLPSLLEQRLLGGGPRPHLEPECGRQGREGKVHLVRVGKVHGIRVGKVDELRVGKVRIVRKGRVREIR